MATVEKVIKLNTVELSLSISKVENELAKNMVNVSTNITNDMALNLMIWMKNSAMLNLI